MSEVNIKTENKVEKKRLRGRNSHEVINQIVERFNASEGWALKRVNMVGMNIEVHLERSADQKSKFNKTDNTDGTDSADSIKEVSNAKQSKEETSKENEPQAESKEVVADVDDTKSKTGVNSKADVSTKTDTSVKTSTSAKPTAKRGREATKK